MWVRASIRSDMRGSHRDPRRRESIPDLGEQTVKDDSKTGDPGMTRTCDLRFRKPSLYPAELRDRSFPLLTSGISASIYQSRPGIASVWTTAGRARESCRDPYGRPAARADLRARI